MKEKCEYLFIYVYTIIKICKFIMNKLFNKPVNSHLIEPWTTFIGRIDYPV